VPTSPVPLDPPPDTEARPAKKRADYTVLGQLETLAVTRVTLTIPSTAIDPDSPPVPLPMLDFRAYLLRETTPPEAKDRAWRHLCTLARAERGDWNLYALGAAFPRLRADANRLRGDKTWKQWQQVHHTLAIEFLLAVHRLRLQKDGVFRRLANNAYDQASGRKRRKEPPMDPISSLKPKHTPVSEHGNPDPEAEVNAANRETVRAVFERLVSKASATPGRHRITPVQATLISRTYLDGEKLRDVAADLKMSEPSASKQRSRAENVVARLLGRDDLIEPALPRQHQPTSSEQPQQGTKPTAPG